jgi:hypothetical protein
MQLHKELKYNYVYDDNSETWVPMSAILLSEDAVWKTAVRDTAGSTTICSPVGDGALTITDLICSGVKKAGTLTVQFNDGVNSEIVGKFYLTDAPLSLSISFKGRWKAWQSAYLEMITTGVGEVTVTVGYYKVPEKNAIPWAAWDGLR